MKRYYIIAVTLLFLSSCKDKTEETKEEMKITTNEKVDLNNEMSNLNLCKNTDTLIYKNDSLIVKSEFTMRGSGVVSLNISDKLIIYNEDESIFGEITAMGESEYDIKLPSTIIARYFVPMFDQFYFDANEPNNNNDFIEVYINKEVKKIKKNLVDYQFETWNDYVKKSFINLRNCSNSVDAKSDINTYEIISINKDSVKIKSISKSSCDAIENFTNTTKSIRWREDNVLLISFYECN